MTSSQQSVAPPAGKAMLFHKADRWRPARHFTKRAQNSVASKAMMDKVQENSGMKPGANRATLMAGWAGMPVCIENQTTQMINAPALKKSRVNQSMKALTLRWSVGNAKEAKVAMADWSIRNKMFFVSVGAAGGKKEAHLVEQADLSEVTHDPLLSQLRYRLRKECEAPRDRKKIGVRCVFSRENVGSPDSSSNAEDDGSLNCQGYGSAVTVTATFGLVASSWVLNFLAQALKNPKK
jgi:hypothetical protein